MDDHKQSRIVCTECENDIPLEDKDYQVGDIVECPYCGSELEVLEVKDDGALEVELVEEEK